jgi:uncharacterized protein YecT (DUF1311 family)
VAVVLGAARARRWPLSRWVATICIGGGVLAGAGIAVPSSAGTLTPPVITEPFTPLPCHHTTTLGLEGCAEGQLSTADRAINEQVRLLVQVIPTTRQRASFVDVETEWMKYRTADCSTVSAVFEGGTIAPIEYALCEVRDDVARSADLRAYFSLLEEGHRNAPRWP